MLYMDAYTIRTVLQFLKVFPILMIKFVSLLSERKNQQCFLECCLIRLSYLASAILAEATTKGFLTTSKVRPNQQKQPPNLPLAWKSAFKVNLLPSSKCLPQPIRRASSHSCDTECPSGDFLRFLKHILCNIC